MWKYHRIEWIMSDELVRILHADVKDIKVAVAELVRQGAVHNHILMEHEKRSTSLETRLSPIEKDYHFRHRVITLLMGSGGIVAIITMALKLSGLLN